MPIALPRGFSHALIDALVDACLNQRLDDWTIQTWGGEVLLVRAKLGRRVKECRVTFHQLTAASDLAALARETVEQLEAFCAGPRASS